MELPKAAGGEDPRRRISALWTFVLFNMAFADLVGFMSPGTLKAILAGSVGFTITPGLLLAFAVLLEIPIAMGFLSRVLTCRANRWANGLAAALTTLFVVAGGTLSPSYVFFAAMEIAGMSAIVWHAWRMPIEEA